MIAIVALWLHMAIYTAAEATIFYGSMKFDNCLFNRPYNLLAQRRSNADHSQYDIAYIKC